jgi:cyanophycinase
LASAVSANPEFIGLGIDENTALIITDDRYCEVMGKNSVTILNGNGIIHAGYTEGTAQDPIPIFGLNLNVVTAGYGYDLEERVPIFKKKETNSSSMTEQETA